MFIGAKRGKKITQWRRKGMFIGVKNKEIAESTTQHMFIEVEGKGKTT